MCADYLLNAAEMHYGLCDPCRKGIASFSGRRCSSCGKPLISERDTCLSCRNSGQNSYERLWVIFPYEGKYRSLLTAYKFGKNLSLANFFAEKILEVIQTNPELKDAEIVPVPPRPGKIKESGWDQVDYLVKQLKNLNKEINVNRCLERRKSKVQKRLSRHERKENLKGRISLKKKPPEKVLILDDVITTGSTIEECSAVFKKGGAQKVYGLCLFYD